jgi:YHS domain-containing protein
MKKLAISFAVIAFLSLTSLAAVAGQHEGRETLAPATDINKGVFKDPVCGMDVTVKGAKYMCEYKKTKYYFCSNEDMEKFQKSPAKYLNKKKK